VRSTGSGSVDIVGIGGSGIDSNAGIYIGYGVSKVTSVNAPVTLAGTGGGTGTNNYGILFDTGGMLEATGSAALVLTGTGAAGAAGIGSANALSLIGGPLATGPITLTADAMDLTAVSLQSSGALTLQPLTPSTSISLGGAAGAFSLSSAALANLVDGFSSITIGRADSGGGVTANAASFNDPVTLRTPNAGDITVNGPLSAVGAGDSIVLAAGGNFINNAGVSALDPGAGRWLVYSTSPALDTSGGLAADFIQYDTTYGVTPVLGSGNGALYRVAAAAPGPTPALALAVASAFSERDARLADRYAPNAGEQATPNERFCVSWPVCSELPECKP
jgi:hypothetical protein